MSVMALVENLIPFLLIFLHDGGCVTGIVPSEQCVCCPFHQAFVLTAFNAHSDCFVEFVAALV